MLEDLKKAERYIYLEYFIIEQGIMWNSILEILEQKVKEGVEVRLIYDDVGDVYKRQGYFCAEKRRRDDQTGTGAEK